LSERWLWTQKEDIGPSPRAEAAMAYEGGRQRVVLFGGGVSSANFNDTWEWDGDAWTQLADMGPSARRLFGMTYNESRQQLVLYGGYMVSTQGLQFYGDTWEWNGGEWTQVADIGPAPRSGCAMTYDTLRHRVVLFGGFSYLPPQSRYFDDTWEWDGTEWTQIGDTGPSERAWLQMVFDSSRECLVLFGGSGLTGWLGDTWEWSEDAGWVKRQDMGPGSILWPTMARTQEHTVLYGFQSGGTGAVQTWEWDGSLWTQRQDMGPSARLAPAHGYDNQRDRVVLFGGETYGPPGGVLGDTWELSIIEQ
jgi:hypothetical protein